MLCYFEQAIPKKVTIKVTVNSKSRSFGLVFGGIYFKSGIHTGNFGIANA